MRKTPGSSRGLRGGSWNNNENNLRSLNRINNGPTNQNSSVGFRVASVPEPSVAVLMVLFGTMGVIRRKR